MICSNNVPAGVRRLADHLKHDIKKGDMVPFYGEIYSQDGELRNKSNVAMNRKHYGNGLAGCKRKGKYPDDGYADRCSTNRCTIKGCRGNEVA